jgi:hypothetical protein
MTTRLNYANYTYDELVTQLTTIIKEKGSWKDTYASSTGQTLIELFSYVSDLLMYYLERRAQESYISTAQLRSSLVNLVQLVGYTPSRKVSATGTVTFSVSGAHVNISIPDGTSVYTSNQVYFVVKTETGSGVVLSASDTSVDAPVTQGTLETEYFNGTGGTYQSCTISRVDPESIENTSLNVYVKDSGGNWVLWTRVDSFLDSSADSTHYVTEYIPGGRLLVRFGDNKFGMAPPEDTSNIRVRYIVSDGSLGNIEIADQITHIESTIYDALGSEVSLSVTNDESVRGGEDEESNESIRYNAPRLFSTGQRGVTQDDYEALMEAYPGIQQCKCWGENEEDAPDYDMYNTINLCVVPTSAGLLTDSEKDDLFEYIEDYKCTTTKITFIDPCYIYIIVNTSIYVNEQYQLSTVETDVEDALEELLDISVRSLGDPVHISDIIACVEGVDGVSYSYTSITSKVQVGTGDGSTSAYETTICLYQDSITPSSVYIYWDDTLVAWDDGAGNILMTIDISGLVSGSGTLSGVGSGEDSFQIGTINYTTGVLDIDFTVNVDDGVIIWVAYDATDGNGDLVVGKNDICIYGDLSITSAHES